MKRITIEGEKKLSGTITISGAKNAAVALVPATLLCDDEVTIDNIPNISDIDNLEEILIYLGAKVERNGSTIKIDPRPVVNKEVPENISSKLRASYYFMSALLGKYKYVEMHFPGGCSIGARPIDQTIKGFKALGAEVKVEDTKYIVSAKELIGGHVYLDMPSVGATVNTMLVAVRARGITTIENAAKEPEIVNLATFLNNMGARITGAGTSEIRIEGVEHLSKAFIEVIPDRIEAGTYVIAGALVGNDLIIDQIIPEHIEMLILKLKEMGVPIEVGVDYVKVSCADNLKSVKVKTLGYPGFATDLQQPLTPLLTQLNGVSELEETIYENRFKNIPYLNQMGADIKINGRKIFINGPTELVGCEVTATDLRAGACLVLAGLKAKGQTIVNNVEFILRGYENIVEKLNSVGAKLEIEEI